MSNNANFKTALATSAWFEEKSKNLKRGKIYFAVFILFLKFSKELKTDFFWFAQTFTICLQYIRLL